MCGIAGTINFSGKLLPPDVIAGGLASLQRRGPDGNGAALFSNALDEKTNETGDHQPLRRRLPPANPAAVTFLHTRLAIIDLNERASQPWIDDSLQLAMVFNGELYNYIELREELRTVGYNFSTQSDSEVLLKAYHHWGTDCFARFRGMFAVAFLDMQTGDCLLARDPFGIKPLYIRQIGKSLHFASQISTLEVLGETRANIDVDFAKKFLVTALGQASDDSIYVDIDPIKPGTYCRVTPSGVSHHSYYDLMANVNAIRNQMSAQTIRDATQQAWYESLEIHMRADVDVGACLSGGIDSSAIVSTIAGHLKRKPKAFVFVPEEPEFSELEYARAVAEEYDLELNVTTFSSREFSQDYEDFLAAQDMPPHHFAIFAQYKLFEAIGESGTKVVIDGQGGDEVFSGYSAGMGRRVFDLIRSLRPDLALQLTNRYVRGGSMTRAQMVKGLAQYALPGSVSALIATRTLDQRLSGFFEQADALKAHYKYRAWKGINRKADITQLLNAQLTEVSMPRLLHYEDANSMHFSIESRVPFLDPRLVEYGLATPDEEKLPMSGLSKNILRQISEKFLPKKIKDRRTKFGFGLPISKWTRANRDVLMESMALLPAELAVKTDKVNAALMSDEGMSEDQLQLIFRCAVLGSFNARRPAV